MPGVYILRNHGRVVFVGAGRHPLTRIYAHANQRRGDKLAAFLPIRPIAFDAVELRPARVDQLAATYASVCEELDWSQPALSTPATDWTKVAANA
jgi:hypothetical protein